MKILLVGACGKMGTCVAETVAPPDKIVCGIDRAPKTAPFPVYQTLNGVREKADVCIDFSSPTKWRTAMPSGQKIGCPSGSRAHAFTV